MDAALRWLLIALSRSWLACSALPLPPPRLRRPMQPKNDLGLRAWAIRQSNLRRRAMWRGLVAGATLATVMALVFGSGIMTGASATLSGHAADAQPAPEAARGRPAKYSQRIAPSEPIDPIDMLRPDAVAATAAAKDQPSLEARSSVAARLVNGRPPPVAPAAPAAARSGAASGPDRYSTDWYRFERH
jgi:hypothetical protein